MNQKIINKIATIITGICLAYTLANLLMAFSPTQEYSQKTKIYSPDNSYLEEYELIQKHLNYK